MSNQGSHSAGGGGQAGPRAFHEETALGKVVDRELLRRLWCYMAPYKVTFLVCLLLLPVASGLSLLQPYLIQLVIDRHIVPGSLDGFGVLVVLFAATLVGEYGIRFLQFYLMQLAGQKTLRDLRCHLFDHIQKLAVSFFHRTPVGRLMTRLTTDIDSLQEALSSGVVTIVGDLFTLTAIVVILLWKSWELALVTFAVAPVLVVLTTVFRVLMRRAYRLVRIKIARLNATLQESVSGISVIQLFAHERRSLEQYRVINREHRNAAYAMIRWDATLYALVDVLSSVAIASIIWYGAGQAVQDIVTLGVLVAFVEYVQKFFIPIRDLSQKYALIQSAMASSERLFLLLDEEEVIFEEENALAKPTFERSIEFRAVSFAYVGENWVLKDVSFTIRKGEKVAFVGHTGAGKTTIISLLLRHYDVDRGSILLDGEDIRRYRLRDLRRLFSVVLQDGFLFDGTISENISLRSKSVSDDDIDRAAQTARVDHIASRYEGGLQHRVIERGENLSQGEQQLVSFARALARHPDVLVLDEATASIDTETEALVQQAVEALVHGDSPTGLRTSVIVAHRLSTIRLADRIIVLHGGEVIESGTHRELMSHNGRYRTLVELQTAEK